MDTTTEGLGQLCSRHTLDDCNVAGVDSVGGTGRLCADKVRQEFSFLVYRAGIHNRGVLILPKGRIPGLVDYVPLHFSELGADLQAV